MKGYPVQAYLSSRTDRCEGISFCYFGKISTLMQIDLSTEYFSKSIQDSITEMEFFYRCYLEKFLREYYLDAGIGSNFSLY